MRTPLLSVLAAAALAAPLAAQAPFPTRPPAALPLRPVQFPPFASSRLANGTDLIVVRNTEQPVVTISLAVPAGGFYVPAAKAGLDDLLATLLTKGTQSRTADQLAEQIEGAGGSIGAGAGADNLSITVSALSQNLDQAMALLADVVTNANFPPAEVELARTQALSGLQLELSNPAALAARAFGREIYGTHPYGSFATPETVRDITRDDILAYYRARVRPAGALLVVAGDVDPAAVRTLAARSFAAWRGRPAPAPAVAALPVRTRTEIVLVNKPGAVQSNIVAGFPFITPRDPALYPLTLANRILGGGTDSRLFLILREQKSWTYGSYSGFTEPYGRGAFRATAEVRTPVTDSALAELIHQVERIRTETPADSEIAAAKSYIIGSFPRSIETPEQIAGAVANARLRGQPADFVTRYRERLAAVTPARMMAAARRYLTTDRMLIVVVGDGQRILPGLQAIAPVRIVDATGNPLTPEDLNPRATAVNWSVSRLAPATLTYRVLLTAQNQEIGTMSQSLARATVDGRAVFTAQSSTSIPLAGVQQADTLVMDAATLAPISLRQTGSARGEPMFERLDYADGHVRGQTRTLSQSGPEEHTIDTTLAPGTVDDNQLAALLPALPLAANARWSLPVFQGGHAAAVTVTVAVTGEASVTTPAGTFACWVVAVTGTQQGTTMYITREAPYTIVKIEITGAPIAMELTQRQ